MIEVLRPYKTFKHFCKFCAAHLCDKIAFVAFSKRKWHTFWQWYRRRLNVGRLPFFSTFCKGFCLFLCVDSFFGQSRKIKIVWCYVRYIEEKNSLKQISGCAIPQHGEHAGVAWQLTPIQMYSNSAPKFYHISRLHDWKQWVPEWVADTFQNLYVVKTS